VAHIQELLSQLRSVSPSLADEIQGEIDVLADRRAFGLNFERHTPEVVELPGRKVRVGDKVRMLLPRGETSNESRSLYRVASIERVGEDRIANLESTTGVIAKEQRNSNVLDLVVVAEFRDPIYPGIVSTGSVQRGGEKPYHAVICAENFHALQTLLFTHKGMVDAVYIDPPYNTGARDWKYNNDYVESDDLYRHSKWLAMMERRLLLARDLLNPDDSVLIVTVDEKEYLRLGLLLEQTFPEARMQMVSSIIKPEGTNRAGEFSRTNEYVYFLMFGDARVAPTSDDMSGRDSPPGNVPIEWRNLRRRENTSVRSARPNQFYAIYVEEKTNKIHSVGEPLSLDVDRQSVVPPGGCVACFPLKPDGSEMLWGLTPGALRSLVAEGLARVAGSGRGASTMTIQYLASGTVHAVRSGEVIVTGHDEQGAIQGHFVEGSVMPKTTWSKDSHNAQTSGTLILSALLPGRHFPFPKSLYAVEDSLRFFLRQKRTAKVVDFFAGSGTTAHAVFRLNKQDGGERTSILVTNNEVSEEEHGELRRQGLRPGDADWEQWGICDYITKPRIRAAITGQTHDGQPIGGTYRFTDIFPMADGFEENVEFFSLTYEAPIRIQSNRDFGRIAPFLWLRAGARGRRINSLPSGWDVVDSYGVLADLDQTDVFIKAIGSNPEAALAFIVTDEDRLFEAIVRDLPQTVEPVRMYESYLRNFEIDAMRSSR
jgi:adenine-specific DNA-methyltransferase